MSSNAVRLAISIALIPFLPGLFFIGVYAADDFLSGWDDHVRLCLCFAACAVIAVTVWLLLWYREVEWNRRRRNLTLLLALAMLSSPVSVLLAGDLFTGTGETLHALLYIWPVLMWAVWLSGTAWIWHNNRWRTLPGCANAGATLGSAATCPQCDYSLTGLHEVRCPECGWSSTVDDIVARSLERITAIP